VTAKGVAGSSGLTGAEQIQRSRATFIASALDIRIFKTKIGSSASSR
jgi:hypothetical protein